jgi:hypothetical protein
MTRRCAWVLVSVLAAGGGAAVAEGPSPVYVVLQATIDDEINPEAMARLPRLLAMMRGLEERGAAFRPTCLLQFNGVTANTLASENAATGHLDRVRDLVRRGLLEIGYDGSDEPTFVTRPRPNFRDATTAEDRWLARLQALRWFLTEWKDPLSGEPDPARAGGMRKVIDVFGPVSFARGVTFEPWSSAETVHAMAAMGARPVLGGFLEPSAYPARNFSGYRGGVPMLSASLAPDARSAPEVFWLDTTLHLSDYGVLGGRVFNALEGPEALEKLLAALDRSRPHVVQVRLGHPGVFAKPGFGTRNYQTPLEHAYDNPKAPNVPPAALHSHQDRAAVEAREQAVLDWLVDRFLPANPGSRFVSVGALAREAEVAALAPVLPQELREAAAALRDRTVAGHGELPAFVTAGQRYFSLADLFGLLVSALARPDHHTDGPALPVVPLLGPVELVEPQPGRDVRVAREAVVHACTSLREAYAPGEWTPVPRYAVPSRVAVDDVTLTAGQFLLVMADAVIAGPGQGTLDVRWTTSSSGLLLALPPTRPRSDGGSAWTVKPAVIRSGS